MKTLAYFPKYSALNSKPVMEAFLAGAKQHYTLVENSMDADVAVIWSCLWAGRMRNNKLVYDHYRSLGKPVIIIEVGALIRGTTWKIAVNNITADGYYGHTTNLDYNRPKKLNLPAPKPQQKSGIDKDILICLQHEKSLQVSTINGLENWVRLTVNALRTRTDRKIIIRPHPRSLFKQQNFLECNTETPQKLSGTYDSFDLRFEYQCMINYNSAGPAINSAIMGCPIIVDNTSLAYPVSNHITDITHANNLIMPMIYDWYLTITHTEYLLEEMAQGKWYTRLEPALG